MQVAKDAGEEARVVSIFAAGHGGKLDRERYGVGEGVFVEEGCAARFVSRHVYFILSAIGWTWYASFRGDL